MHTVKVHGVGLDWLREYELGEGQSFRTSSYRSESLIILGGEDEFELLEVTPTDFK